MITGPYRLVGEVYYEIGGVNFFTGDCLKRGYYFSVTPQAVTQLTRSTRAFSGLTIFLVEAKRFNARELATVAPSPDQINAVRRDVLDRWHQGHPTLAPSIPSLTQERPHDFNPVC